MPDYDADKAKLVRFLREYASRDGGQIKYKYLAQLTKIANRQQSTITIDLDDLYDFENEDLVESIESNGRRYTALMEEAIDEALPESDVPFDADNAGVMDIFLHHRQALQANNAQNPGRRSYPPALLRRYEVYIRPRNKTKAVAIREVKAASIGKLTRIRGIVTRVTDVKPMVTVATYTCDRCSVELYQEVNGPHFMPMTQCVSETCQRNNSPGQLFMQTRGSKFTRFQELKIQEMSDQVPVGHIPRTMTVHLRGELTRTATAGDIVTVTGVFLPTPYAGFRAIRAGLLSDTYLEAHDIQKSKRSADDAAEALDGVDEATRERIERLSADASLYDRMATSIAPEIYGHLDVKKALLLLLVGGVSRNMSDGMKIRGDINVCLMGDPGVAKSQLLKYISTVAPRGVYTTGRGSSGVGLTAAVTRDPFTGEMVLEGGALVLADKGVCCIDEFDKMEEGDRTAIYEVMEQQTISIAKAGITTTLNARTSILAAANPAWGRYNPAKSAAANINLPAALLSRFDLLFLILDRPDPEKDLRLAEHITYLHRESAHPKLNFEPLDAAFMRHYIAKARTFEPRIAPNLNDYIVSLYLEMRNGMRDAQKESYKQEGLLYASARSLLAVLRLSTALARLRFSDEVNADDIEEAMRLLTYSRVSLKDDEDKERQAKDDIGARVLEIIKSLVGEDKTVARTRVEDKARQRGITAEQLQAVFDEYAETDVIMFAGPRIKLCA